MRQVWHKVTQSHYNMHFHMGWLNSHWHEHMTTCWNDLWSLFRVLQTALSLNSTWWNGKSYLLFLSTSGMWNFQRFIFFRVSLRLENWQEKEWNLCLLRPHGIINSTAMLFKSRIFLLSMQRSAFFLLWCSCKTQTIIIISLNHTGLLRIAAKGSIICNICSPNWLNVIIFSLYHAIYSKKWHICFVFLVEHKANYIN